MRTKAKQILILAVVLLALLSLVGCQSKTTGNNVSSGKNEELKNISTQELQGKIGQADWVIVDTRINDAFNGWKLEGVSRGGHIKGAVDFAANWLQVDDKDKDKKLDKVLKDKGITPQKNVVLYDANGKDAKEVAQYLKTKGINNLYLYNVKEWADKDLPMESYPNYQMLVPAAWVNDLIKTNNNGKPYKIFEVSWGKESKDYLNGHIPGAVHINTDEVEEPPIWNRISDKRLEQFAINNGITTDTTVVLYGTDPMGSYRVAAILKYMGVKDVRVLNGGYGAWERAGYEQETKVNNKKPGTSFGATVPVNKNYIIDLPQAKQILADKAGSRLVDIRSWDEYIGKTPGYSDITAKGRPAGAVWGHAGSDPNHLEDFRNIDNTMRNANEILAMWKEWGITPDKRLAFYCGTGWRAAEVLIYADVMGLKNIALYDGGWYEWSANPANPIEIGEPKR
ncbi:sulfurtransferase [Desulfotomaculum nigrificans]|uniref:sulfurtransferase n=1 Tax=Desulfotomaculum nigrificans TaxID=1565 RepID=UPI0001FADF18|nr:sulfurtransferase [Desulfotomaculum nigrificans]